MARAGSMSRACLLLALLSVGCRLPGREGPVPQSLTDCRRLSQQGIAALERGDIPKAEQLLAQAVAAYPTDPDARRHYAESLWHRGARGEAIVQLEQAVGLVGEDASLRSRLAEMQLATGQLAMARENAQRALDLDGKSPAAWAVYAGVMRESGQPREALAAYIRALGYAPNDRAVMRQIAELYQASNQPDRALQTLQALADTYPSGEEPGDVLYMTGLAYTALGQYDDGAECFAGAIRRGLENPETYCRLAEAELTAGRLEAAAQSAQKALALYPDHAPSRQLLERIETAEKPSTTVLK